ncbi:MAG TPA: SCO1664 family protein [Chloroflexi bacterium]|jgi:uncharacterized repeat protein (TIGR03843 family)|nr:SCO1664 family protein [Chloroflexota bacterium]
MNGEETVARTQPISEARALELLQRGEITLQGQFPWSSNYTFLASVRDQDLEALAVYKPCRGERPLWDFDSGTLCRREVAAYRVSRALGWPDIPPVVLRDGPHGLGSLQIFVEADYGQHYFTLRERPDCDDAFRRVTVFDYLVNNADRKGGHVLIGNDGQVWAIDHGLTFHTQFKLRTVIWDYAGQPLPQEMVRDLRALQRQLDDPRSALVRELYDLISPAELAALSQRLDTLLRDEVYPNPRPSWRNVPYPLV